jgi:hypothetical protein
MTWDGLELVYSAKTYLILFKSYLSCISLRNAKWM